MPLVGERGKKVSRKRHRKRRIKRLLFLIACFSFSLSFFSYLFIFSKSGYLARQKLINEIKDLENRVQELNRENNLLRKKVKKLRNKFYIEQKAREFGMIRPEEKIIKFVDKKEE